MDAGLTWLFAGGPFTPWWKSFAAKSREMKQGREGRDPALRLGLRRFGCSGPRSQRRAQTPRQAYAS